MHLGRILCSLAISLSCALGAGVAHAQTDPTLITDRQDYLPGETVILMGYGFEPGESIDVSIAIDDDATGIHIGDYDWMVEQAGATGEFTTFWTVPLEAYGMTLRATALGLTSSRVATSTFYDSITGDHKLYFQITGRTNHPTDGYFLAVNGLPQGILWTDMSLNGPILVPAGSTVTYSGVGAIGSTYTNPSGQWTFVSATHAASGFTAGPVDGSTTVILHWCFAPVVAPTNAAPTFAVNSPINLGEFCPADGTHEVTFAPADFLQGVPTDPNGDPVTVTFADGDPNSKTLVFDSSTSSITFTLVATDNPSARAPNACTPLLPLSSTQSVTVTAIVNQQANNAAPTFTSSANYDLGSLCLDSVTVPIDLADFNIDADDPEDDPFTFELSRSEVTLTLPVGIDDAVVSCPVVITVTDNPEDRNCGLCMLNPMSSSITVSVTAHLYRNTAPVITAYNLDLGDIVGQLSGGTFAKTVSISAAMFDTTVTDAEGDPVAVTADVSNVTLVGPGLASATVVLTATDDPSARTGGTCTSGLTSSTTAQVTARIVYRFDGPLFPLNWCIATKVRRGCIVPVRFRLFDCNNVQVTTVPLNPAGGPTYHTLSVAFNQANAADGAVDVDEIGCGDTTDDFRYFLGAWTYILETNSTYNLHTTYVIRIYPNDGTVHNVMMSIK